MQERQLFARLRADRELIDQAAARLRHLAVQDEYRGRRYPEHAYGLASILDTIALGLTDVPDSIRTAAVRTARGAPRHRPAPRRPCRR
ncbi:hypothetical protein LWC33_23960 [Pseudonocardia sp. RS11V-5]|uniref:hypothetical protein n=1 Tax=Pseudonocardia terrae TaxID=2905831 RepID=UPI001E3154B0|nr:hypothetical protein [Pseudonocardia terrae]MCE3554500.1 hypothetical protein [Pseudonocardia terrae]